MLDVIYNDPFTTLSLIDNADIEKAYIVDDELQVYATIEYWCFDIIGISETRQKTLEKYLQLEDIEDNITYRKMLADKSIKEFNTFIEMYKRIRNL